MRRALTVLGAAALAASVFAGCGRTLTKSMQPRTTPRQAAATSTTPNSPPTATTLPSNSLTITLQEFSSIEEGMTLDQVTATFGSPGKVDRAADSDRIESRRWYGLPESDGLAMIVFRDGVVFGKTQLGLQ
jgi:outer membrane protein assembly factor BamE (lipoprotein component of BamABCDE complex)